MIVAACLCVYAGFACVCACMRTISTVDDAWVGIIYGYARCKLVLHSILFTMAIHTIKMRLVYQLVEYLVLLLIVCVSVYMCVHLEL